MKKILLIKLQLPLNYAIIAFVLFFISTSLHSQLYTNEPLSTGATAANGTVAPAGYTWSEMQANTGNTTEVNTSLGYGALYNIAGTSDLRIADDFIVPAGQTWNVSNFAFFCYQTSYAGTTPPIDVLRVQIFNGDPSAGGTLVAGNMTTNVYDAANSVEAFIYRTANTTIPSAGTPGTTRKVWKVRAAITATLTAGTYWVVYQGHATNDGNFFMPPATAVGSRGAVGANAKQFTAPSTWANILDLGNPAAAPDVPQDMPFIINDGVLSTNQFEKVAALAIYPNPVNATFEILNSENVKLTAIDITDGLGRTVKTITPNNAQTQFECADLQAGNYFVKLTSLNGTVVRKIIKN